MHDPAKSFAPMHRDRFKAEPMIFVAPGRVNLIGEHTDYAEGFVMPAAINFATLAGISPRTRRQDRHLLRESGRGEKSLTPRRCQAKGSEALDRLSDGRGVDPRRRGTQDSRLQPEHLERCAAGVGPVELGSA